MDDTVIWNGDILAIEYDFLNRLNEPKMGNYKIELCLEFEQKICDSLDTYIEISGDYIKEDY